MDKKFLLVAITLFLALSVFVLKVPTAKAESGDSCSDTIDALELNTWDRGDTKYGYFCSFDNEEGNDDLCAFVVAADVCSINCFQNPE